MNKEAIAEEIVNAFKGVSLGNGIGLWEAQAIDNYESKEVQKQHRLKDEKEDWQKLSYESLQNCNSSLSFFDAEGMRFHLLAFVLGDLYGKVNDPIFHLTDFGESTHSKLSLLNKTQKRAISIYLEWCLCQEQYDFDYERIKRALSEYWYK